MKKLVITMLCLFSSMFAFAEDNIKFVNADGSPAGELCIAAANNEPNLAGKAYKLGIPAQDMDQVYCNGKPLMRFARQYRDVEETKVTAYIVSIADENPETRLCMAALTSDDQYARIKDTYFRNIGNVESSVHCNNMPLRQFVRKYRDHLVELTKAETAAL